MLAKFNTGDVNTTASDAIHSYIANGFRIDAKESVIDPDKDKGCTFKAVLKKDVDGIECKTVIKLSELGDDKNKKCIYNKVESVGDTKWSEETQSFSCTSDHVNINNTDSTTEELSSKTSCKSDKKSNLEHDPWLDFYRDSYNRLERMLNRWAGWSWNPAFKNLTKWECRCPSVFKRLDDYLKLDDERSCKNTDKKDEHVVVNKNDSLKDIYNKIVAKNTEDNKVKPEDKMMDDIVDKVKASASQKSKTDNLPKQDPDDELEDSLIKLVRYIFGK